MLNNLELIKFCQGMLGAPYWFNTSCIKASDNLLKINKMRFPEAYKEDIEIYQSHIQNNEVVTDDVGLIKGFIWSDGNQNIPNFRGTIDPIYLNLGSNGCPDKSPNGLLSYVTTKTSDWGLIEEMPEIPGIIVTTNGHLGIYEGKGKVIEAIKEKGVIYSELKDKIWKFWYKLPFIEYIDEKNKSISLSVEEPVEEILLNTMAISTAKVLFREEPQEDAKFLDLIEENSTVQVYNDSTLKWLHLIYNDVEGYAFTDYFIYYPKMPHIKNNDIPAEFVREMRGKYRITKNVGLKNKAIKGTGFVVLPQGLEVLCTGGVTNKMIHVYAEYNNKIYAGYIPAGYLEKIDGN